MRLARLAVFSAATGDPEFSPFVPNAALAAAMDPPQLLQPLILRLTEAEPEKRLYVRADLEGYVCVVQEVDTANEPLVKVQLTYMVGSHAGWRTRVACKLRTLWPRRNLPSLR